MPAPCFAQNDRKIAAMKAESLFNMPADRNSSVAAGDAVPLTEDPHPAGAVIHFKNPGSHSSKRTYDTPGNGYFSAGKAAGIVVDPRDGFPWRTSCQQQHSRSN
jgi:hypothetical protein